MKLTIVEREHLITNYTLKHFNEEETVIPHNHHNDLDVMLLILSDPS